MWRRREGQQGSRHKTDVSEKKLRELELRDRDCALTQLVRKFLTENGHRCANALEDRHSEGGTDSQAIDEIVETIAQGDHPGQGTNIRISNPFEPVASTLGCLQVLQERTSQWNLDYRVTSGKPDS